MNKNMKSNQVTQIIRIQNSIERLELSFNFVDVSLFRRLALVELIENSLRGAFELSQRVLGFLPHQRFQLLNHIFLALLLSLQNRLRVLPLEIFNFLLQFIVFGLDSLQLLLLLLGVSGSVALRLHD